MLAANGCLLLHTNKNDSQLLLSVATVSHTEFQQQMIGPTFDMITGV